VDKKVHGPRSIDRRILIVKEEKILDILFYAKITKNSRFLSQIIENIRYLSQIIDLIIFTALPQVIEILSAVSIYIYL
jgi:hypothetical protein